MHGITCWQPFRRRAGIEDVIFDGLSQHRCTPSCRVHEIAGGVVAGAQARRPNHWIGRGEISVTQATVISRPKLTLPEAEAAHLRAVYAAADVILEYGSGGSTVMAAEMPGKTVFSVESDKDWALMMRSWFVANPPAPGSDVDIVWADIGDTREWGHPKTHKHWDRYARYPLEVWVLEEFRQPDVVLVDGRFRAGCAMAAAFRTTRPVVVLVDDYKPRRKYHAIEEFLGAPKRLIGRMAEFEVTPMPVPADRLQTIIEMMTRP